MRGTAGCILLAVFLTTTGGLGCGHLPSDEAPLPDALTCAQTSWSIVSLFATGGDLPSNLALRDGTLYVSSRGTGIIAQPVAGGDPTVLTDAVASRLWLDGDWLYFGTGGDMLLKVPLAGGTPTVVVDGMTSFVAPEFGAPTDTELDASFYYWDLSPQLSPSDYSVWRAPRAGGAAEKLAEFPPRDTSSSSSQLTLRADSLIVALDGENVAYAIPLAGGSTRALPAPRVLGSGTQTALVGSSTAGVLWTNERFDADAPYPTTNLSVSDVAGSSATTARPFWPSKPPSLRPTPFGSWPDGAGGWLITGSETFAGGRWHNSVWAVDAAGATGTRVGCDPAPEEGQVWSIVSTGDAVYAVVNHHQPGGTYWLLVRIDRAPAAPFGS